MKPAKQNTEIGKLPPQSIEIEEAVLGMFLLFPGSLINLPMLNKQSFYKIEHQVIFESILELASKSKPVDTLTVTMELKRQDQLKNIGGPVFITRLTNKITSDTALENYCHILIENETARRQIEFGYELVKKGYDQTEDVFLTNEFMADKVHEISTRSVLTKEIRNEDLANEVINSIHQAKEKKGVTGVPTGFKNHDRLLGGLQPSDLVILAARPSMGKTALALCYFRNAVVDHGKRMIFITCEMSAKQLFQRLLAIHLNLPATNFKNGNVSRGEWNYINENLQPLLSTNLVIVEDCKTLQQITMRVKKERMKGGVDGVIIDYLQLVEYPGVKTREQEISKISRGLKLLAKEVNVPIVALSQLTRDVEKRNNKRPILSDLRESGSIEQDADIVEFLYRPNYYGNAEPGKENLAWLCVEKHRNGNLQDIPLKFDSELTKFTDESNELAF